jgi:hypothetical protein
MEVNETRALTLFTSAIAVGALLAGCASASRPLYYWGHYEDLIYAMYATPGAVDATTQIETLEADYQKARAENQPVPPGFHAHLGVLYYQAGKLDQARQQFLTEKTQYPESAIFMDGLLNRTAQ